MTWDGDQLKKWSDKFIPEVQSILGRHFIKISSLEQDMYENTDMLYCKDLRFTYRARKFQDYLKFSDEITIRSYNNGSKTELDKIVSGWGDIFFYCFSNENETALIKFIIADISKLRTYLHNSFWNRRMPFKEISNSDGTKLIAIKYAEIPDFVIYELDKGKDLYGNR